MRALIIDSDAKLRIKALFDYAMECPFSMDDVLDRISPTNPTPPPGSNPVFRIELAIGYKVVFTIEDQPSTGNICHISISVDAPDKLPQPYAVEMIMKEFGFPGEDLSEALEFWIENTPEPNTAISVVWYLKDNKFPEHDRQPV